MNPRDPAFWRAIAAHPEVSPHIFGNGHFDIGEVVAAAQVTPFRFEHGGYLYLRLDTFGFVHDLHALFTPEGWGRPASFALKTSLADIFEMGAHVVTASEVRGWWRSRPPRSFGFEPAGDFRFTPLGELRTWVLTRARFEQSPVFKRMAPCLQQ